MVHCPAQFTRYFFMLLYAVTRFAPVEAAELPRRQTG